VKRHECCCGRDCWEFTHSLGVIDSDWDVVSGSWTIDSGSLKCTTEGVLITTQRQQAPVRTGNGYNYIIKVDLVDFPVSGTRSWKVICGFEDEDNFDWVEFKYDESTEELIPTLWRRAGGSDTEVLDPDDYPGNDGWSSIAGGTPSHEVFICYSDVQWAVTDNMTGYGWVACHEGGKDDLPDATDHGLFGFLGEDGAMFANLEVEEHWESNPICPRCPCICLSSEDDDDYACLPSQVTMTFIRTEGVECTPIDDVSLTMYESALNGDCEDSEATYDAQASHHTWISELLEIPTNDEQTHETYFVRFRLVCDWQSGFTFYFECHDSVLFNGSNLPALATWSESSCDPLYLVFHGLNQDSTTVMCTGGGYGIQPPVCGQPCTPGTLDGWQDWKVVITL